MENARKKIHRFFHEFESEARSMIVSDPDLVHQWKTVLRFRAGELIQLFASGLEVDATITKIDAPEVHLMLSNSRRCPAEPERRLTAYVSMFRKEPFEWMLEKLTEIGVAKIVPIETERTIRFPWRPGRFKAILKEAAEQSGRGLVPDLAEPIAFSESLKHVAGEISFLFEVGGEDMKKPTASAISFYIGPEGGWTEKEIALAKSSGVSVVGLGKLTLRAETAAVIAAYELLK